jgi:uncharacterized repeat protein (TIGR01451 family)
MRKTLTIFLCGLCMAASGLDPNHITITRISAPYFIVDGNVPATVNKAYVGFEVKNNSNSATTYSGIQFSITSISTSVVGQTYSLVSPANGICNVGTLAPGESRVCYFYVSYPAHTTAQATFNIQLANNTAGIKTTSFIIYNRSCISANAGGTATQTFTNQDIIGGLVYDDVTYAVGNVQNGDESDFQVAVSSSFDPTKILLLGTQVIASTVPGIPVGATDSLYFITGNGSTGASVTIRWTFKISATNFTTYLLPCAGATSGATNYKYALNTNLGQGTPITVTSAANPLTISKSSDQSLYGVNTTATFTITINNPGSYGVTIDKITDEIPSGFSFLSMDATSQVTSSNSTVIPSAGATGTITFEGGVNSGGISSYYIGAGSSIVLKYKATVRSTPAQNLLTTVRDYVGITQVGSATNTVSASNTLPVNLLSFNGNWIDSRIQLTWKTASESNCRIMEIEKYAAGSFQKIGEVQPLNSSSVQSYSFTDAVVTDNNQYRLKITDNDGRYSYSQVISLKKTQTGLLLQQGFPNPFTNQLTVQLFSDRDQQVRLKIIDVTGRIIRTDKVECVHGINSFLIKGLEEFSSGAYYIRAETSNTAMMQKIMKQ